MHVDTINNGATAKYTPSKTFDDIYVWVGQTFGSTKISNSKMSQSAKEAFIWCQVFNKFDKPGNGLRSWVALGPILFDKSIHDWANHSQRMHTFYSILGQVVALLATILCSTYSWRTVPAVCGLLQQYNQYQQKGQSGAIHVPRIVSDQDNHLEHACI